MSTAEEPVVTPSTEGTPPEVVPNPPAEQAPATPAATAPATPAEPVDLMALLEAEFEGQTDDPQLAEVAKTVTADTLKNLPPELRAFTRALLQANKVKVDAALAPLTKREEEIKAKEIAVKEAERKAAQMRIAAINLAAKAEKPGDAPNADILTAEGLKAHMAHEAKVAQWNATEKARQEADNLAQQEAWDALCDRFPDLRKPAIGGENGEFDKFFMELNAGVDLTKAPPRVGPEIAAELFFNKREADALRAEKERATKAATSQRMEAARAMGRSAGGGRPDPLAYARQIMASKDPEKDAKLYAYLAENPEAKAAYLKEFAA